MMDAVMRAHHFPIARHDRTWIIRYALLYQKIAIIPCYEAKVLALRALSDWYPLINRILAHLLLGIPSQRQHQTRKLILL